MRGVADPLGVGVALLFAEGLGAESLGEGLGAGSVFAAAELQVVTAAC